MKAWLAGPPHKVEIGERDLLVAAVARRCQSTSPPQPRWGVRTGAPPGDGRCRSPHFISWNRAGAKVSSGGGQVVLESLRVFLISPPFDQPFLGEEIEPSGQHVARDPETALQLVESVGAEHEVAQHQQAPALAGHLERTGYRAVLVGVGAVQHHSTG